jgi:hypothetical protein
MKLMQYYPYVVPFSLELSGLNLHTTATFPPLISIFSSVPFFTAFPGSLEIGAFEL